MGFKGNSMKGTSYTACIGAMGVTNYDQAELWERFKHGSNGRLSNHHAEDYETLIELCEAYKKAQDARLDKQLIKLKDSGAAPTIKFNRIRRSLSLDSRLKECLSLDIWSESISEAI